jgi:hypothetical protein
MLPFLLLLAHHSITPYDMTREFRVEGAITRMFWGNPHAYVSIDTEGGKEHWILELESPNLLRHYGWKKDTVKPGDRFACKGARSKDPDVFQLKCFEAELAAGRKLRAQ